MEYLAYDSQGPAPGTENELLIKPNHSLSTVGVTQSLPSTYPYVMADDVIVRVLGDGELA